MPDSKEISGPSVVALPRGDGDSTPSETRSKDRPVGSNVELTFARRGEVVESVGDVDGFDSARMRDRALLNADEEKALLRRIDIRIMAICSIIFLIKNLDSENISNARTMNKGTPRNIMTQLKMSSDEYNLLTVLYYVCPRSSQFSCVRC